MKVHINTIRAEDIRDEMRRDSYQYAELLGTFNHPEHTSSPWTVRLYRAADALVIDSNGTAIWDGTEDFDDYCDDYGIKIATYALPQTLRSMNARLIAAGFAPLDAEDAALFESTDAADAEQREALLEDLEGRVLGVHR